LGCQQRGLECTSRHGFVSRRSAALAGLVWWLGSCTLQAEVSVADDVRVEMARRGGKMALMLGDVVLAEVEPGIPAQQLARYIEMQLRAGFAADAIRAMLRGESQATTGAEAPKATPKRKKAAPKASGSEADASDLASVLTGTVAAVKKRLASGTHDAQIAALLELETAGKGRKGVLSALRARART